MIKTIDQVQSLPAWDDDEARKGGQSWVPCWPYKRVGYGGDRESVDCPDRSVLVGVLGADRLFRSEDRRAFDPGFTEDFRNFVCDGCKRRGWLSG